MDSRVEGSIYGASLSSTSAERVYAGGATPIKHGLIGTDGVALFEYLML